MEMQKKIKRRLITPNRILLVGLLRIVSGIDGLMVSIVSNEKYGRQINGRIHIEMEELKVDGFDAVELFDSGTIKNGLFSFLAENIYIIPQETRSRITVASGAR